jgi:hypothetical protein
MLIRDWDASYRPPRRGYLPAKNHLTIGGESPFRSEGGKVCPLQSQKDHIVSEA